VRDDRPSSGRLRVDSRQDRCDVLVGQAVEAVAPDPLLREPARQGEGPGERGNRRVKRRVEAGHLGDVREALHDVADGRQVVRLVQGRQGNELIEIVQDLPVHDDRLRVLQPPVDHPVAHGPDPIGRAGLAAAPGKDRLHGPLLAELRPGGPRPFADEPALPVFHAEARIGEEPLDLPVGKDP